MNEHVFIESLERLIESRKNGDPNESYVASLLQGDEDQMLKKIIEEAGEMALAVKSGSRDRILNEAADLWFHMLVALAHKGVSYQELLETLKARKGMAGLEEKAGRADP